MLAGAAPAAADSIAYVKDGKRTLVPRFNRAAKRSLRRGKSAKLSIRVAYTPQGGTRQVTTLAAKLKR